MADAKKKAAEQAAEAKRRQAEKDEQQKKEAAEKQAQERREQEDKREQAEQERRITEAGQREQAFVAELYAKRVAQAKRDDERDQRMKAHAAAMYSDRAKAEVNPGVQESRHWENTPAMDYLKSQGATTTASSIKLAKGFEDLPREEQLNQAQSLIMACEIRWGNQGYHFRGSQHFLNVVDEIKGNPKLMQQIRMRAQEQKKEAERIYKNLQPKTGLAKGFENVADTLKGLGKKPVEQEQEQGQDDKGGVTDEAKKAEAERQRANKENEVHSQNKGKDAPETEAGKEEPQAGKEEPEVPEQG